METPKIAGKMEARSVGTMEAPIIVGTIEAPTIGGIMEAPATESKLLRQSTTTDVLSELN